MGTRRPQTVARAWRPRYLADEVVLGLAVGFAVHALPIGILLYKARHPSADVEEEPLVARPVVAATLLKLGKPLDPSRLPDRFIPRAPTARKPEVVASQEDPLHKPTPDAGAPPPPEARDSDLENLVARADAFAEDAGRTAADEGHPEGIAGGTETDPSKVQAGDQYAARLAAFFHERWTIPTVISQGEANKLCVSYRVSIGPRMNVWHVSAEPVRSSGNELFDDSAHAMLQRLLDERAVLPEPPEEVAALYRGRTLQLALTGGPQGDVSKCR